MDADDSVASTGEESDLLSELHASELSKFQDALASVEREKSDLNRALEETQRTLDQTRREVSSKQDLVS